jgi:hypothetical protein
MIGPTGVYAHFQAETIEAQLRGLSCRLHDSGVPIPLPEVAEHWRDDSDHELRILDLCAKDLSRDRS